MRHRLRRGSGVQAGRVCAWQPNGDASWPVLAPEARPTSVSAQRNCRAELSHRCVLVRFVGNAWALSARQDGQGGSSAVGVGNAVNRRAAARAGWPRSVPAHRPQLAGLGGCAGPTPPVWGHFTVAEAQCGFVVVVGDLRRVGEPAQDDDAFVGSPQPADHRGRTHSPQTWAHTSACLGTTRRTCKGGKASCRSMDTPSSSNKCSGEGKSVPRTSLSSSCP